MFILAAAGLLLLVALIQSLGSDFSASQLTSSALLAAGIALVGLLMLIPTGLSGLRLMGKPLRQWPRPPLVVQIGLPLVFLPALWALGAAVASSSAVAQVAWLLLPPLHVLTVGLPVWLLLRLSRNGLPGGTLQQEWGVFSSGLVIAPVLILVLELLVLAGIAALAGIYLATQPGLALQLDRLIGQIRYGTPTEDEVLELLWPYLVKPGVAFAGLVYIAVLVPLIEEVLKPIGVWLLAGRELTPTQGFTAGALSGAGYALVENLGASANLESWAALVLARAGTAVLHIYTAALMGWALAAAWQERRYVRLAVAYLLAVSLHGLWNGLSVFGGVLTLPAAERYLPPEVVERGLPALAAVVVIGLTAVVLLLGSNLRLQRAQRQATPPLAPPLAVSEPPAAETHVEQP